MISHSGDLSRYCTWYCPYSVALFEWHAYLIQRLENLKTANDSDSVAMDKDSAQIAFDDMGKPMSYNLVSALLLGIQSLNLPFIIFSGLITRLHLKMAGVISMKLFESFLPENTLYANDVRSQATLKTISWFAQLRCSPSGNALDMSYWVYSKALFDWHAYLVKVVENWWCPFYHDRKDPYYRIGAINQSYWHLYPEDAIKLVPEDRENPLWYSAENKTVRGERGPWTVEVRVESE